MKLSSAPIGSFCMWPDDHVFFIISSGVHVKSMGPLDWRKDGELASDFLTKTSVLVLVVAVHRGKKTRRFLETFEIVRWTDRDVNVIAGGT